MTIDHDMSSGQQQQQGRRLRRPRTVPASVTVAPSCRSLVPRSARLALSAGIIVNQHGVLAGPAESTSTSVGDITRVWIGGRSITIPVGSLQQTVMVGSSLPIVVKIPSLQVSLTHLSVCSFLLLRRLTKHERALPLQTMMTIRRKRHLRCCEV